MTSKRKVEDEIEDDIEQLESLISPLPDAVFEQKLKKSLIYSRVYLAVCILTKRNKKITSGNVSKLTNGAISRAFAYQVLEEFVSLGYLEKVKRGFGVFYLPNKYTFRNSLKDIAVGTLKGEGVQKKKGGDT